MSTQPFVPIPGEVTPPAAPPEVPPSVFRWATVTSLAPLRIRLDGDTDPLPGTPESIAGPLTVGARVWVQFYAQRMYVLGAST